MKTIKLHTPKHLSDSKTESAFNPAQIVHVQSITGDDDKRGTHFYLSGVPDRQMCLESANVVRKMIEEAKAMEQIELNAEAVNILIRAAKNSVDGRIHFIEGSGCLAIMVGTVQTEWLQGRDRRKYDTAKRQLESQELMDAEERETYLLNERGEVMGDLLAESKFEDKPFSDYVKLPMRTPEGNRIGIQFNQTNNNVGNVNNAVSEAGTVNQTIGPQDGE